MNKNNIVFLSRYKLTHLFGKLTPLLMNQGYAVRNIAYSNVEANMLRKKYNIEPDIVFTEEIRKLLMTVSLDMSTIHKIDEDYLKYSGGKFNLNSAIISDRGFVNLTYTEALHLAQIYYIFWNNFLDKFKPFIIFHESTSLLFNHICCLMCLKNKSYYSACIVSRGLSNKNFMFVEYDSGISLKLKYFYENINVEDFAKNLDEINCFIDKIRSRKSLIARFKGDSLSENIKLLIHAILFPIRKLEAKRYDKLGQNIDYYLKNDRSIYPIMKIVNRLKYKCLLSYDHPNDKDRYYFFALHLEPEAVLLYWSGGKFSNQISLIESIARCLPPNTYLYVKDHVNEYGYRQHSDYKKILSIPNVKLIDPRVSAIELIEKSEGVITINGTVGFEGIILKKNVFLLGSVYYCHYNNLYRITDASKIRDTFIKSQKQMINNDNNEIRRFAYAYLKATYQGDIDQFFLKIKKNEFTEAKIQIIAEAFLDYINFLSQINPLPEISTGGSEPLA